MEQAARRRSGAARGLRIGVTLLVAAGFLHLLRDRLTGLDARLVLHALLSVSPLRWVATLTLAAVSFLAVAGQELALHRHLATHSPAGPARRAGMIAAAVGQTVGFGPVTGTLVRWRMVPGLGLWQATRLSLAMSLGFLCALAVATALACLAGPATALRPFAGLVLGLAGAGLLVCAIPPAALSRRVRLPNLICAAAFLGWAMVDLLALSLALWVLLAPGDVAFVAFLPAFLTSLSAGLLSAAPAGVGAFEVTLLSLLPGVDPAALIAATLAFRAAAYALPALVGAVCLLHPPPAPRPAPGPVPAPLRSGALLIRQGGLALSGDGHGWLLGRLPHSLVALGAPTTGPSDAALASLTQTARAQGRLPCVYKADARLAAAARRAGWQVRLIAREAWLHPARFTPTGPARATLRRKLRHAAQAGVTARKAGADLPLRQMAAIAAQWATDHGGERGFSMGRWCPHYVADQRVFLAHRDGRMVAFVTFHATARDWTLDLMRSAPGLPDGTMQALILAALDTARAEGIARLSLAAAPLPGSRCAPGLARFKAAFAPAWTPLYIAAPTAPGLLLAGAEVARAILRPGPLPPNAAKDHHEHNEIASAPASWQRVGRPHAEPAAYPWQEPS